jgi:peptide-N4-(N-acetyl-beta-glucosaminyl)asparagine amidase
MYEAGWKRNLEYVIGFSCDDVQDVTWRYSCDHEATKARRKACNEKELIDALLLLRQKRTANASAARKKFLTLRIFSELSELLIVRKPTENERKGRSSGSLSWRLQRGEAKSSNFHVITLNEQERTSKTFNLRYSCARDIYERGNSTSISGWSSLTYSSANIFRKVENDHKMAYLSRTEDSTTGDIQFSFDFSKFVIKSIDFKFETKTFESGAINVELLDANDKVTTKNHLINASKFSVRVRLSGGKGDCAWQHAQVFRQSLKDTDFPFQLLVKFH